MIKILKPEEKEQIYKFNIICFFSILLILLLISIGILERVSSTIAPPIYDPLGYIAKAQNVWEAIHKGAFFHLLSVEPISRLPGSSLLFYPFGFINDFKGYLLRSTLIPIYLWAIALYIIQLVLSIGKKRSLISISIIICLIGVSLFYHFENNGAIPVSDRWGLVDPLLAAWSALGIAILLYSIKIKNLFLTTCSWVIITTTIFIKPSGVLVIFCGVLILTVEIVLRDGILGLKKKQFIGAVISGFICSLITVFLCVSSPYLSKDIIKWSINAQQIHLAIDNHSLQLIFIDIFKSIGYWQAGIILGLVFFGFCSNKDKNENIKNGIRLVAAVFILIASAYWIIKCSGFESRFNYPFILISLLWIISTCGDAIESVSDSFVKIVSLYMIVPTFAIILLLFSDTSPIKIEKVLNINLSAGQYKEEVEIANNFIKKSNELKRPIVISDAPSILTGVIDAVDVVHSNYWKSPLAITWKHTLDWSRSPGFRVDDILVSDFISFQSGSNRYEKEHIPITCYQEEMNAINYMYSTLNENNGVIIYKNGTLSILEIKDKQRLRTKIQEWVQSMLWANDFYIRNPSLLANKDKLLGCINSNPGEVKLCRQNSLTACSTESAIDLKLSSIPPSYKAAVVSASGPWIESVIVNNKHVSSEKKETRLTLSMGDTITLSGWAADIKHPLDNAKTYVILESVDKKQGWALMAKSTSRKDVADFYSKKELTQCGFDMEGKIPKSLEGGEFRVVLLTEGKVGFVIIPTPYILDISSKK